MDEHVHRSLKIEARPTISKSKLRLRAAAWTSAVALAPNVFLLIVFYGAQGYEYREDIPLVFASVGASLAAAGISGFVFGWPLVNPAAPHDTSHAIMTGLKVTMGAHGLASLLIGGIVAVLSVFPMFLSGQRQLDGSFFIALPVFAILVFISSLWFFGWLTLPLGGAAGYWLSKHYRMQPAG